MSTVAPVIAAVLYTAVSHAAPYWLGVGIMVVAAIVVARARIANTAKRPAAAVPGAFVETPG